jgi:hypothetical protein
VLYIQLQEFEDSQLSPRFAGGGAVPFAQSDS